MYIYIMYIYLYNYNILFLMFLFRKRVFCISPPAHSSGWIKCLITNPLGWNICATWTSPGNAVHLDVQIQRWVSPFQRSIGRQAFTPGEGNPSQQPSLGLNKNRAAAESLSFAPSRNPHLSFRRRFLVLNPPLFPRKSSRLACSYHWPIWGTHFCASHCFSILHALIAISKQLDKLASEVWQASSIALGYTVKNGWHGIWIWPMACEENTRMLTVHINDT